MLPVITSNLGTTVVAKLGTVVALQSVGLARLVAAGPGFVAGDPGITANPTGIPGLPALDSIAGGLVAFGLVFAVVGIVVSAICWAVGAHNANSRLAAGGKGGVLVGVGAALLVGGADPLVTFFSNLGGTL
jgi:hypothetical protein